MNIEELMADFNLSGKEASITLTDEQQKVVDELREFLEGEEQFHLLIGFAGVGKTTVLQKLAEEVLVKNEQCTLLADRVAVMMAAPTNKAVKVLMDKAQGWGLEIDDSTYEPSDERKIPAPNYYAIQFLTTHKLLGLKHYINYDTGEESFKPDYGTRALSIKDCLIIVDEASMVNAELWGYIEQAAAIETSAKFLFVGDSAQLPPVNEVRSKVFDIPNVSTLTTIIRHGEAIGDFVYGIRSNLGEKSLELNSTPEGSILVLPTNEWFTSLAESFSTKEARSNINHVRCICWTNALRQQLNNFVRAVIYGKDAETYEIGENLVAINPVMRYGQAIMHTSDEAIIDDICISKLSFTPHASNGKGKKRKKNADETKEYKVWELSTEKGDLYVVHPDDARTLDIDIKNFRRTAKETEHPETRRDAWKNYFELKGLFSDVDYSYVLTSHKSQGSTFNKVYVNTPNVMLNKRTVERNQCLYVACTRPSQQLILLKP